MGLVEIVLGSLLILSTLFNVQLSLHSQCESQKIENIDIVESIDVDINNEGGLDNNNTNKVFNLVKELRASEKYYHNTIENFNEQ